MSKSLNNVYTLDTLKEKGYEPLAYRYLSYTSHYRNKLNFTWEGIESSQKSLNKLRDIYKLHLNGNEQVEKSVLEKYTKQFEDAINDDLNFPVALATVWELARCGVYSREIANTLKEFDKVLSLDIDKENKEEKLDIPEDVEKILNDRKIARDRKDYKKSDELRDILKDKGYTVLDTKDGQKIEKI